LTGIGVAFDEVHHGLLTASPELSVVKPNGPSHANPSHRLTQVSRYLGETGQSRARALTRRLGRHHALPDLDGHSTHEVALGRIERGEDRCPPALDPTNYGPAAHAPNTDQASAVHLGDVVARGGLSHLDDGGELANGERPTPKANQHPQTRWVSDGGGSLKESDGVHGPWIDNDNLSWRRSHIDFDILASKVAAVPFSRSSICHQRCGCFLSFRGLSTRTPSGVLASLRV
jgi:hypothetical protein